MDENLWQFWRDYGAAPGGSVHEAADLRWLAAPVPLPPFHGVPFVRLDTAGLDAAIAATQLRVNRGGTAALWWAGPASLPVDLVARLDRAGLMLTHTLSAMAVALDAITHPAIPADFRIEQVRGAEMRRVWAYLVADGWGLPAAAGQAFIALEQMLPARDEALRPRYLGFVAARPVAASAMVLAAEVAGIHAVATAPDMRGQGIAAAMTALPLREAREQGYRLGVVQAPSAASGVFRRLGFQPVGDYRCYAQAPAG